MISVRRKSFLGLALALILIYPLMTMAATEADDNWTAGIQAIINKSIEQNHLEAVIVQVRCNGKDLYLKAAGNSMSGVPATPDMHFRNGAMALTYMATMLLELIDEQPRSLSLDEKLSDFFPEIPHAGEVTLKQLANMTSGYHDYVYEPEVLSGLYRDPFRQFSSEEMIEIGVTPDPWFQPGKNWSYSHTNYVILGRVIEKITGMPLDRAMEKYILDPMHLRQTKNFYTPQIPSPALHIFSSERRSALQIPHDLPFYEETTFWNPSWTTAAGAVETTDIQDMTRSMEIVGSGGLLSPRSYQEQVSANLVGFGKKTAECQVCDENTIARNYGLGVTNRGPWITQTKSFAGTGATTGYLPSSRLAITVVVTYKPEAFDDQGNNTETSVPLFTSLANALAPHSLPSLLP